MKTINLLPIIPFTLLAFILIHGISERKENRSLIYAIESSDSINLLNNPLLKITPTSRKYSINEVALTKNQKPCLIIYEQKIYQIPKEFFELHSGGVDHLTQSCGYDITFYFNMFPHTNTARELLNQFYYAEIAK